MLYKFPFQRLRQSLHLSERKVAESARISRMTLRRIECGEGNPTVASLLSVANHLGGQMLMLFIPRERFLSDDSSVAVSMKVVQDGFSSWKIHFMELVDEFRKTLDVRLVLLPPVSTLDKRLSALLASIVLQLCLDLKCTPPDWAMKSLSLDKPWFVADMDSLKAMAIRESPLAFRRNNIFVLENFLSRF